MALLFAIVLLALAVHYAAWMIAYWIGFRCVMQASGSGEDSETSDLPFVSVVVPARNEADTIGACLDDLLRNVYPAGRFEIIVVDDLSTDGTAGVVEHIRDGLERSTERLRLIRAGENQGTDRGHKKRAISLGIAASRGSVILSTDADCRIPGRWIRTMVEAFTPDTAFVSGPVLYDGDRTVFGRLQALEFMGLIAVGAGAIGIGRPNMCNGASLAYRRRVFDELGGFAGIDHLSSGDDELFMQKIAYTTPYRVRFCADPRAVVRTRPVTDPRAFFEQRRRWASKGVHYVDRVLVATIGGIFAFYTALLFGVFAALFDPGLRPALLCACVAKVVADAPLMISAARHFGMTGRLRYLPLLELVHPPYVALVGAAGLRGGYSWKGRTVDR